MTESDQNCVLVLTSALDGLKLLHQFQPNIAQYQVLIMHCTPPQSLLSAIAFFLSLEMSKTLFLLRVV